MVLVTDYSTLKHYVRLFAEKKADLVILQSLGGLGKTHTVDDVISENGDIVVFDTHLTPLANYKELIKHRDKGIVFRDLDTLLKNNISVSLLKQLTDTKPIKTISYRSTSKLTQSIPDSITTISNALIETNNFQMKNANVKALATRGFHVMFSPSVNEIVDKMKLIKDLPFKSLEQIHRNEVFSFVSENKDKVQDLNLRHLLLGFSLRLHSLEEPKFDWQKELLKNTGVTLDKLVLKRILENKKPVKEKLEEFKRKAGKGKDTFYRLRKEVGTF